MEQAPAGVAAPIRGESIPPPSEQYVYRRVLLLATTCTGKTTVVRQLLGSDPEADRFPSTSTAKTTIAETEIVASEDDVYRAVVTFFRRDEVVDHLTDCATKAALAALRNAPDGEVRRLLLD